MSKVISWMKMSFLLTRQGTNSNVDEHSQRTKDYIDGEEILRRKHNEQSIALKDKADAVIVLVGRVEKKSGSEIDSRIQYGHKVI